MTETMQWDAIRRRINGLWPRHDWTDAERELAVRRLSSLNPRWLEAAVDEYRSESTSTVFRLAELLERYKRIANAGEAGAAPKAAQRQGEERERWTAERTRDHAVALSEIRRFDRQQVAEAVADLRAKGWVSAVPLPSNFADWPISSLLFVHARLTLDRIPRSAANAAGASRAERERSNDE